MRERQTGRGRLGNTVVLDDNKAPTKYCEKSNKDMCIFKSPNDFLHFSSFAHEESERRAFYSNTNTLSLFCFASVTKEKREKHSRDYFTIPAYVKVNYSILKSPSVSLIASVFVCRHHILHSAAC